MNNNILDLTGNTPLLPLNNLCIKLGLNAKIFAKLESFNPGGSVKDRVAVAMIEDAEANGFLKPGGTIIEPTSGNTGIGLAWAGRLKGYKVILTMPDSMSVERRNILKAYGATLVLTPGSEGMKGAIRKARELQAEIKDSVILGQFDNPANPKAHYLNTGPEIYQQSGGNVDIFVAGVGTGGTISGAGRALKELKPGLKVVAVEPSSSPVLSGGSAGPHKIQGIGAGFVPKNYDAAIVDNVISVSDSEAFDAIHLLNDTESILAGISSGAALAAAIKLASVPENNGMNIVVVFPDGGEKYLSVPGFIE